MTNRKRPITRDAIRELLGDGVGRSAREIAVAVARLHDFSIGAVLTECSALANDRRFLRERVGRSFVYRLAEVAA